MRRVHLRGHTNILKRYLVHVAAFNLSLVMRQIFGVGTPRGLQGRLAALAALVRTWIQFLIAMCDPSMAAPRDFGHAIPARQAA
jgi:hypothetical protein